jgi:phosphocarrier protein HPr
MGIMMLAAAKGGTVMVQAIGPDEDRAVEGMEKLFMDKFGEKE